MNLAEERPWTVRDPLTIAEARDWLERLQRRREYLEALRRVGRHSELRGALGERVVSQEGLIRLKRRSLEAIERCSRQRRRVKEWLKRANLRANEIFALREQLDVSDVPREVMLVFLARQKLKELWIKYPVDMRDFSGTMSVLEEFLRESMVLKVVTGVNEDVIPDEGGGP